jgi:hypothetical protein
MPGGRPFVETIIRRLKKSLNDKKAEVSKLRELAEYKRGHQTLPPTANELENEVMQTGQSTIGISYSYKYTKEIYEIILLTDKANIIADNIIKIEDACNFLEEVYAKRRDI